MSYPDMTELFRLKNERRKRLAALPIERKMEIVELLQEIGKHAPGWGKSMNCERGEHRVCIYRHCQCLCHKER